MALLSPSYSALLPFLLIFSIPLAIFATATTIIAFFILSIRVAGIYIDLAIAIVPYYFTGLLPHTPVQSVPARSQRTPRARSPNHHRKLHSSTTRLGSLGTATPVWSDSHIQRSAARDFEGVGGWRIDARPEENDLWISNNSRLELPADHVRRHQRSFTGNVIPTHKYDGSRDNVENQKPMTARTSPNMSIARTPPSSTFLGAADGYFGQGLDAARERGAKKNSSNGTPGTMTSVWSGSSRGSSVVMMKGQT